MALYEINVAEVHGATYQIEAETKEKAIQKYKEGEADFITSDYSYTLEDDEVEVEEI